MKQASLIAILLLPLLIVGCSFNRVSVERFTPEGEVSTTATFTIQFSEPLAPVDQLGVWSETEYVSFTPSIKAKSKWLTPNTLIVVPSEPLLPMQEYTAIPNDNVLFKTELSSSFSEVTFNTPYFMLKNMSAFWNYVPLEENKALIQATLTFNYPVSPEELLKNLTVTFGGEELSGISVVTKDASEKMVIQTQVISVSDEEKEFELEVSSDLTSTMSSEKKITGDRTYRNELPPTSELAIQSISSGYDGATAYLDIQTSQPLKDENIKKFVLIPQAKEFTYTLNANILRIEANLESSDAIDVTLDKGLTGIFGGKLKNEFTSTVSLVELAPQVNFTDRSGRYMMLNGNKTIEISSVNIDRVNLSVTRVYQNNLIQFLNYNTYYMDNSYYDDSYNPYYTTDGMGKEVFKQQKNLKADKNWLEKFTFTFDKAVASDAKGLYVIAVASEDEPWVTDQKFLSVSDLGIITKLSSNQLTVFVNSIANASPIGSAKVSLISTDNQVMAEGVTDGNGFADLRGIKDKRKDFVPRAVIVEKNGDFNFVDLLSSRTETSRFDVGGYSDGNTEDKAYIYSERNLYRPGETVHMVGIARNEKNHPLVNEPVTVKIYDPRGRSFGDYAFELNREGSFELPLELPSFALTGEYFAELKRGTDDILGTYRFSVEEFQPDKIRVQLSADKLSLGLNDVTNIGVNAEYLFGAKASGVRYQADVQLRHKSYSSKSFSDYDFASSSVQNSDVERFSFEGNLDQNGVGGLSYKTPLAVAAQGVLQGTAFVSVFDLTGRTVNRALDFTVFPRDFFVGIKNTSGYYSGVNSSANFKIAVVDKEDKIKSNVPLKVTLIRYEWVTVLKRNASGSLSYQSDKKTIVETEKTLTSNGSPLDLKFTPKKSGNYQLRVQRDGENFYNSSDFYVYDWGSTSSTSFEVDKEGRVEIVADKQQYKPGDRAKLLFTGPFDGTLLVTTERNGVMSYKYLDFVNRTASMELPISSEHLPNVYVTATLFRKHSVQNTVPLMVGHGFISLKVDEPRYKLPIAITAPKTIKPNSKHEIVVKTTPEKDIYVTIAVVDEGILQIKNYQTPNPYNALYAKVPLKTESYDLYGQLLPEILQLSSFTGGDMGAAKSRVNPIAVNRYKLLSVWSGVRKTDASGIVKIPVTIPQFYGSARIMAVAFSGAKYGSGDVAMTITDDLVIEPQLPRTVTQGDSVGVPVTLLNTTSSAKSVTVSMQTKGSLVLKSNNSVKVTVPARGTAVAQFSISSTDRVGVGVVTVEAKGDVTFTQTDSIAVKPASPYATLSYFGSIKTGEKKIVSLAANTLPGSGSLSVLISRYPVVQFSKQVKSLIGYPHGCLEQTVSKAFPQLYFPDLVKLAAPDFFATKSSAYFVKEAIKKIESQQRWDGALTMWQEYPNVDNWVSVYATHFIVEARKAGFAVSDDTYQNALRYMRAIAKNKESVDYTYYKNGSRITEKKIRKEVAYALFTLALAGSPDISAMNYLKSKSGFLTSDSKYLLASAYALTGKWNAYYEILPKDFVEEFGEAGSDQMDSQIRTQSIKLYLLAEIEPGNAQVNQLLRYLVGKQESVYSTHDLAMYYMALGKAYGSKPYKDLKVTVSQSGTKLGVFNGSNFSVVKTDYSNGSLDLTTDGSGEVFYAVTQSGIFSGKSLQPGDKNLQVRRTYYDYKTGTAVSAASIKQGDLIVVSLSLVGSDIRDNNIAITDIVPAGFEIENARFQNYDRLGNTGKQPLEIQSLDIRDDRLVLFTDSGAKGVAREYRYLIRAVNKGRFVVSPLIAESMYNPSVQSVVQGGTISIQ